MNESIIKIKYIFWNTGYTYPESFTPFFLQLRMLTGDMKSGEVMKQSERKIVIAKIRKGNLAVNPRGRFNEPNYLVVVAAVITVVSTEQLHLKSVKNSLLINSLPYLYLFYLTGYPKDKRYVPSRVKVGWECLRPFSSPSLLLKWR